MQELFAWNESIADSTISDVNAAHAALKSDLDDLIKQVDKAKANGTWDGLEQELFSEIFTNWKEAAGQIAEVLSGVSGIVDGTNNTVKKFRSDIMEAMG